MQFRGQAGSKAPRWRICEMTALHALLETGTPGTKQEAPPFYDGGTSS